eukprot:TRINITY_DN21488_c0_g1_i1.p1 TRINITY_DN21488_c0_g1~~TRINITY_DN21488_c0_g1_i1.p1  ORF type:complete len:437 (+),score=111.63 TRINITY_DN21488_c0_g1_i1:52-1311(+)
MPWLSGRQAAPPRQGPLSTCKVVDLEPDTRTCKVVDLQPGGTEPDGLPTAKGPVQEAATAVFRALAAPDGRVRLAALSDTMRMVGLPLAASTVEGLLRTHAARCGSDEWGYGAWLQFAQQYPALTEALCRRLQGGDEVAVCEAQLQALLVRQEELRRVAADAERSLQAARREVEGMERAAAKDRQRCSAAWEAEAAAASAATADARADAETDVLTQRAETEEAAAALRCAEAASVTARRAVAAAEQRLGSASHRRRAAEDSAAAAAARVPPSLGEIVARRVAAEVLLADASAAAIEAAAARRALEAKVRCRAAPVTPPPVPAASSPVPAASSPVPTTSSPVPAASSATASPPAPRGMGSATARRTAFASRSAASTPPSSLSSTPLPSAASTASSASRPPSAVPGSHRGPLRRGSRVQRV